MPDTVAQIRTQLTPLDYVTGPLNLMMRYQYGPNAPTIPTVQGALAQRYGLVAPTNTGLARIAFGANDIPGSVNSWVPTPVSRFFDTSTLSSADPLGSMGTAFGNAMRVANTLFMPGGLAGGLGRVLQYFGSGSENAAPTNYPNSFTRDAAMGMGGRWMPLANATSQSPFAQALGWQSLQGLNPLQGALTLGGNFLRILGLANPLGAIGALSRLMPAMFNSGNAPLSAISAMTPFQNQMTNAQLPQNIGQDFQQFAANALGGNSLSNAINSYLDSDGLEEINVTAPRLGTPTSSTPTQSPSSRGGGTSFGGDIGGLRSSGLGGGVSYGNSIADSLAASSGSFLSSLNNPGSLGIGGGAWNWGGSGGGAPSAGGYLMPMQLPNASLVNQPAD